MSTQPSSAFSIENTKVQMRKGILEFCILGIISRGEVYASDILDALRNANMLVVEGTVYPLLTRLKNVGLLTYEWKESTSGPPRKYFTLTESGRASLDELTATWDELAIAVNSAVRLSRNEHPANQSRDRKSVV